MICNIRHNRKYIDSRTMGNNFFDLRLATLAPSSNIGPQMAQTM